MGLAVVEVADVRPVPTVVVVRGGERGARGCSCPSGAAIADIGVGADGAAGGEADRVEFNRRAAAAAAPDARGSADFGAVETADLDELVDATAPVALVDCCGKLLGVPCVGALRMASDPVNPPRIPGLPAREPSPARCALAESIVSASAAKLATRISDGLRSVHVNIMVPLDTPGELSDRPCAQATSSKRSSPAQTNFD